MSRQYDSRTAEKFVMRLPPGLRAEVEEVANAADTSMNTVFIQAVRKHLDGQRRQTMLLNALDEAVGTKTRLLLERLDKADQRADDLEGLLSRWSGLLGVSAPDLRDETLALLKRAATEQCQFPQSCSVACGCKSAAKIVPAVDESIKPSIGALVQEVQDQRQEQQP